MIRRELITIAVAVLVALLCGAVLIVVIGESPLDIYGLLLHSTWGGSYGIGQVIFQTTPLIMTGLAVALAFKVGLFNIGAEGQMLAGSFATALCGAYLPASTPGVIAIPACIVAGMLAGAAIGAIPGWLRAYYGAHEVINTIMLNFVTAGLVLWLGTTYFFVPYSTHTADIIPGARLGDLGIENSAANTSLFLAIALAAIVYLFLTRTRIGFEWRAVGHSWRAAENAGINVKRAIIGAMAASGALAGAVGANYVLGYKHFFEESVGGGIGFMGIAVALLGRNHPLGIIAAALLFGTLSHGGLGVSEVVPKQLVNILQAIVILAVAASAAYMKRLHDRAIQVGGDGGRTPDTSDTPDISDTPDTSDAPDAPDAPVPDDGGEHTGGADRG